MNTKGTAAKVKFMAALRTIRYRASYLSLCFLILWLVGPGYTGAQSTANTGTVEGAVFVLDSGGASYVPGAKIVLQSPSALKTETDANGRYIFHDVAPGSHILTASFPGLQATLEVVIEGGAVAKADMELKPVAVTTSVTVADTANDDKVPTITETITEKTVADAPNANERFESLLPLVPGVVRGPDGRINMKGARNTQSGALVNSANVTDPATGSSAISLPIDVVSSVQVISNPYDPQYGNLTGALSTVETKTGDYEKAHFSIQNVVPRWRERNGTIAGLGAATPRLTFTGPLLRNRAALMQSFEYRFVRTPVNSLPPLQRDTRLEGFNSYTQFDLTRGAKQTATVSVAIYP